jgi:hypothetical protein
MIGRIEIQKDKIEVRTAVPGSLEMWLVKDGDAVTEGQPIAKLDPSSEMVYNSLLALYLIGTPDDIPAIAPFAHGVSGFPPNIAQRATETIDNIRKKVPVSVQPAKE